MTSNPYEKLHALENFDPKAFIGDQNVSQELCDFMIVIAVFFNDLKDLLHLRETILQIRPSGSASRSKEWAAYGGFENHFYKTIFSLVHEFLNVIEHNKKILEMDFYKEVYRQMYRGSRACWDLVVAAALNDATSSDPLFKILLLIRNKVAFHFDLKALRYGYRENFFDVHNNSKQQALISRGESMEASRFYFADAASQGWLIHQTKQISGLDFMKEFEKLAVNIHGSIFELVDKFIQRRTPYIKGAG